MRVVQFHRPGHGPRTGVVRDGTVYDVTAEAGDALSLLLAHHAGVPEPRGVPAGTLAALDVAVHEDVAHLLMPVFPSEVWGAGVTYKKSAEFREEDATSSKGIYDQVYVAPAPNSSTRGVRFTARVRTVPGAFALTATSPRRNLNWQSSSLRMATFSGTHFATTSPPGTSNGLTRFTCHSQRSFVDVS